ncbi:uncharacterized protein GIQ15_05034 [Arthroderma uncinatum]|uniref:uncharacterized protein n=1 Tax=Arthroderma uncinatum TaxID=74035 RepID=UPI00144A6708|nr:uncharacterized protein GIQ15_05034 [Arthroderma uncinatum]KAF3482275.1 hypothetical protein GIQ15_05034 [Arthroderma uncinatum]
MRASTVSAAFCGLQIALSAPILLPDAAKDTPPLPAIGSQPCSAIFPYITSSRGRQILIDCDAILNEKYEYLVDRWPSSGRTASPSRDKSEAESPFLPGAAAETQLSTPALKEQLDALPTSTSTSTSTSTTSPTSLVVVSLPSSTSVPVAYASRIRLEDIVANRDLPAFLDWLSARPIMAWTLIVAVLIIVFFVSAVVVEVVAAIWSVTTQSNVRQQSQLPPDHEEFYSGDIYLSGPEKRLAAVILIDEEDACHCEER